MTETSELTTVDSWPARHGATAALLAFLTTVGAAAVFVICEARLAPTHDDFWSVAVPGVSTGAGTLALAAVTVWLARYQARRDQEARSRDAELRASEHARQNDDAALREARKVIATWTRQEGGSEVIQITNAGRETIVEVFLDGAVAIPLDQPRHRWEWTASGLEGMVYQGRDYDWCRPYIVPGDTQAFAGWMSHRVGGRTTTAKVDDSKRFIEIDIAWTDPAGNYWRRHGYGDPQRADAPYRPRPPLGLEDAEDQAVVSGVHKAMAEAPQTGN